jgi:hypothetical protein
MEQELSNCPSADGTFLSSTFPNTHSLCDILNRLSMDKKAKEILFKTYWSSAGWIEPENIRTDPADFEYAKQKGLMFDPLTITKAELITELKNTLKEVSLKMVTDAFLCSLTNKRLDWCSGLGSYANAKRLLTQQNFPDYYFGEGTNQDISLINFERIKWGGVRHAYGLYNLIDLKLLNKEEIPIPSKPEIEIFKNILKVIESSQFGDTPSKLRDNLKEVFKVSKDERHIVMEILGSAEILRPLRHDRKEPGKHDWRFVLHWRGEDKYDKNIVNYYFGRYGIS